MREFVPVFVLCSLVILYRDSLDYESFCLVLTNVFGVIPFIVCYRNGMVLESLPFYTITLTSGSYHLCNAVNYAGRYCSLPKAFYVDLDFINSYVCIMTVLIRLTRTNLRVQLNALSVVVFSIVVPLTNRIVPLSGACFGFGIVSIVLLIRRTEYVDVVKRAEFQIGLALAILAFTVYLATVYCGVQNDYWLLHSFGWHVPVMTSSALIVQSTCPVENRIVPLESV
jgi:hypothetical protein